MIQARSYGGEGSGRRRRPREVAGVFGVLEDRMDIIVLAALVPRFGQLWLLYGHEVVR